MYRIIFSLLMVVILISIFTASAEDSTIFHQIYPTPETTHNMLGHAGALLADFLRFHIGQGVYGLILVLLLLIFRGVWKKPNFFFWDLVGGLYFILGVCLFIGQFNLIQEQPQQGGNVFELFQPFLLAILTTPLSYWMATTLLTCVGIGILIFPFFLSPIEPTADKSQK